MSQNTVSQIIDVVCEVGRVDLQSIIGPSKTLWVTRHRQIAMHLCRDRTAETAQNIASRLGRKDHTTVLHADRLVITLREENADWRKHVETMIQRLDDMKKHSSYINCPEVSAFPPAPLPPTKQQVEYGRNFRKPSNEEPEPHTLDQRKQRICMTTACGEEFLSMNFGDRFCPQCKYRRRAKNGCDARLESHAA